MPKPIKARPAPAVIDLDRLKENQLPAMFDAEDLGRRAAAMLAHCDGLKKERTIKCILAGIFLAQVRVELGHGPFGKWLEKHLCHSVKNGSESTRTAYRYIALAAAFSRSSRMLLPELIGANQLSLDLANVQDEGGRTLLAKLDTFVGQRGLTELMKKHGVIKLGGPREKGVDHKPPATPEQLYAQSRDEIGGGIERLELLLLRENRLQYLTGHPDEIQGVVNGLRTLADRVEAAAKPLLKPAAKA